MREPISHTSDTKFPIVSVSFASFNWYEAKAIRLLYERGPLAFGAMDPFGKRHWLLYSIYTLGKYKI